MDLHVHIYNSDDIDPPVFVSEDVIEEIDPLIDEKDVVVNDIYDGFNDGTDYIQYIIDSEQLPNRMIEVRIPVSWIKPEMIEQLKQSWRDAQI